MTDGVTSRHRDGEEGEKDRGDETGKDGGAGSWRGEKKAAEL